MSTWCFQQAHTRTERKEERNGISAAAPTLLPTIPSSDPGVFRRRRRTTLSLRSPLVFSSYARRNRSYALETPTHFGILSISWIAVSDSVSNWSQISNRFVLFCFMSGIIVQINFETDEAIENFAFRVPVRAFRFLASIWLCLWFDVCVIGSWFRCWLILF